MQLLVESLIFGTRVGIESLHNLSFFVSGT